MPTAFSAHERIAINEKLKQAAKHFAATKGMRKTTVDALAQYAGISKGAFYSFYGTKEVLFLSMLEQMHTQMYDGARAVFQAHEELAQKDRLKLAFKEVCHVFMQNKILMFMRDDLPLLLRRVPQEILAEHYIDDAQHLKAFLCYTGVKLKTDLDSACAVLRLIVISQVLSQEIGAGFDDALNTLIDSVCETLVA